MRCGPIVTCHKDKYIRTYDPPCVQIHFEKPYIFYTNRLINAILLNKERIASDFSNPVYVILSFCTMSLSPQGMMPFKCYSFFSLPNCGATQDHSLSKNRILAIHKNPLKAAAESEKENQNVQTSFSASANRSGESPNSSRFTS